MKVFMAIVLALCIGAAGLSGCTSARGRQGAVIGGVGGAAVGAIAGKSVGGAIAGGAIGATAGYIIGAHSYPCWRTNIFGQRYRGTCLR